MGVEASHLGVPALFLLFEDLGKQYLRSFKGYDMPPWCQDQCAFLVEQKEQISEIMEQALFDASAREQVGANFNRRFRVGADSAPAIARQIQKISGSVIRA